MIARSVGLVLAIVVCAWFALGIRQVRDTSRATAILSGQSSPDRAEVAHAQALLRSAGTLNPDLQVDLLRGQAALLEHDRTRATRIVQSVVRREPMNLEAWLLLAEATPNVSVANHAVARLGALDPRLTLRHP